MSKMMVPAYKHVGRPTHDSQKREEALEKLTNVFREQYTLPTDTNEIPNLPTDWIRRVRNATVSSRSLQVGQNWIQRS
jgi:hypothetical protein